MRPQGLLFLTIGLVGFAIPLAAQDISGTVAAISNQAADAETIDPPATRDPLPETKTPDVFVDLSDVEGPNAELAMADPLSAEIQNARAVAGEWFRGIGLERWTRQPLLAALLSFGLVFVGYLVLRRLGGRSARRVPGRLPHQVVELIGFAPINSRQQLQLIRVGSKLVLVAVSVTGTEPLAEITDPVEVDQILAECQASPASLVSALTSWGNRSRTGGREAVAGTSRRPARALFEA